MDITKTDQILEDGIDLRRQYEHYRELLTDPKVNQDTEQYYATVNNCKILHDAIEQNKA